MGHAETQALQLPQCSFWNGASYASSTFSRMAPRNQNDPRRGWMSMVLRPNQPSPARWASSRSSTAPVST